MSRINQRPDPAPSGDADRSPLPDRYAVRRDDDGTRFLACREAPTVRVTVDGSPVSAQTARNAPSGTIFLDGAAQGPPFLDTERQIHNLDHHEDCVRAFTLAACEQALVLVLKGFDLRGREWTVRANEPDLDTVLALWVLLNHMRLASSPDLRRRVIPLVRVEGVIDAHGLELQELTGLPEDLHRRSLGVLDTLHELELELTREAGRADRPSASDPLERTAALLRAVDALVYSPEDLDRDGAEVDELAREELPDGSLVVACRSPESIYRAEQTLRWLYGDRLGVVVLVKRSDGDSRTVTLRQVDPFLPASLEAAYAELNLLDPAAGPRGSSARWGGSDEIGGSPRGVGTRLAPREIVRACARAFRGPTWPERTGALGRGVGAAAAGLLAAWIPARMVPGTAGPLGAALALLAVALTGLALARALRRPGLYGLRPPVGRSWWLLLPGALIGALLGGGAVPATLASLPPQLVESLATGARTRGSLWTLVLAAVLLPVAAELLFRGLVQTELSRAFRTRPTRSGSPAAPWTPRPATGLAAALSAATPLVLGAVLWRPPLAAAPAFGVSLAGALLLGLACGMARDRAESLVPPIVLHLLAAGTATGVALLFF